MDSLLDIADLMDGMEEKDGILENVNRLARELRKYKCEYPVQYKLAMFNIYHNKENGRVEKMVGVVD